MVNLLERRNAVFRRSILQNISVNFSVIIANTMEQEKLKKGDKVVMHTCRDAKLFNGTIWVCAEDEKYNKQYDTSLVYLEGLNTPFKVKYLQKVILPQVATYVPTESEIAEYLRPESVGNTPDFWNKQIVLTNKERAENLKQAMKFFYKNGDNERSPETSTTMPTPPGDKLYAISFNSDSTGLELKELSYPTLTLAQPFGKGSVTVLKELVRVLKGLGCSQRVTIMMYYPQLKELMANLEEENIVVIDNTIHYNDNDLNLMLTSF